MDEGWRTQNRFGREIEVPPMGEWATLINDPSDCYVVGRAFYSGAVIDTLVLGGWPDGVRFETGGRVFETCSRLCANHQIQHFIVEIKTPPVN